MKKKILVVDRDKDILEIITYVLTDRGYEVISSRTEDGMLSQILNINPDAVLLDIIKPSIEGTELCRAIKGNNATKNIPVIVLSTHQKAAAVKEICADEIVAKPFDISELVETLEKQLQL
jgi:DNA-binding response OmpR family regulator